MADWPDVTMAGTSSKTRPVRVKRCEELPGSATIMARSHPHSAALLRRLSINASCAPCRRAAGIVLAPASRATPSWMNMTPAAMGRCSSSTTKVQRAGGAVDPHNVQ